MHLSVFVYVVNKCFFFEDAFIKRKGP